MEAPLCTNTATACLAAAGLPLPCRRAAPSTGALSISLRLRLPTRGLRCAGPDWTEPSSFVGVANKTNAAAPVARKARPSAGAGDEGACFRAIHGVDGGTVDESVSVSVTPSEQSLVVVDSVSDEALSNTLPSKKADIAFTRFRLTRVAAYIICIKNLDFEETSTYIIYGTGAFFAGWILSAVVSAIDSIPLLPQVLEIVGLGYTIWFSTRYLLFKENRDELFVKVDDIKRRIVGSGEE